jgi:hypothetical protein
VLLDTGLTRELDRDRDQDRDLAAELIRLRRHNDRLRAGRHALGPRHAQTRPRGVDDVGAAAVLATAGAVLVCAVAWDRAFSSCARRAWL